MSEIQETKKYFAEHPEVAKPVLRPAAETLQTAATEDESTRRQWPDPPAEEAFYGLAGDFVKAIEAHSEADPVAILVQLLCMFGNVIGRGPHFTAEADRHYSNIFVALVGATSKGRKGSSLGQVRRPFATLDAAWVESRNLGGLSSGEGLIWAVRDPIERRDPIRERSRITGYQTVEADPGVADKRLLVFESEFALVLRVMARESNTLAAIIRQAWDTGNLRTLTKNTPAVATGAHISIIAHVTGEELRRYLDTTELVNGFANRFPWLCVKRSKSIADDDARRIDPAKLAPLVERLHRAVDFARTVREMQRDDEACDDWRVVYPPLSAGRPGLLGAVTSRGEAQVMRLALIYALLDCSLSIGREHLRAALALWSYAEASARFIFGDAVGDPTADAILDALRRNAIGLTRTEISSLFGRNKLASEISRALRSLAEIGAARTVMGGSGGRPTERWVAL